MLEEVNKITKSNDEVLRKIKITTNQDKMLLLEK